MIRKLIESFMLSIIYTGLIVILGFILYQILSVVGPLIIPGIIIFLIIWYVCFKHVEHYDR